MLLGVSLSSVAADTFRVSRVSREGVESRLREYGGKNAERAATLKRMFVDAGCGEFASEQAVRGSKVPNIICVLPGTSSRFIIVGAHFDRVSLGDGVVDNWSGASLLPSLYEALKIDQRQHTFIFIGFTDEEMGLVGSRFYARKMTAEQVAATDAMVNMDVIGLAPTNVWLSRSDRSLAEALAGVANYLKMPISAVNFERVGSTDSEAFRSRKIPRITIHSMTQKSHDLDILHTRRDKISALNLDDHYNTYHLVAVYLAFLDGYLGPHDAPTP